MVEVERLFQVSAVKVGRPKNAIVTQGLCKDCGRNRDIQATVFFVPAIQRRAARRTIFFPEEVTVVAVGSFRLPSTNLSEHSLLKGFE